VGLDTTLLSTFLFPFLVYTIPETGIERVQALADISRSALCCHSNETRAPIANPPNSAQLEGTPTIPPTYIQVCAVVWECGEGQTDRHTDTQTTVITIYFASATPHALHIGLVGLTSTATGRKNFALSGLLRDWREHQ